MAKCQAEKLHPKEYKAWNNMKRRCYGDDPAHHHYKSSNITVCSEWINNFWAFFHDVGSAPGPQFSLERKDNLKGYYKDNVKWATALEQNNNKRQADTTTKVRDSSGRFIAGGNHG